MMKEIKLEDINPLLALKNNLWQAMNLLKGFVDASEYHFVLFLLTLQRKGVLKNSVDSNQDDLRQQFEYALRKLDNETGDDLREIYRLYEHTIRKVNSNVVYELIRFLNSLDQKVLNEHFAEIFDELLYKLSKLQGRLAGEFMLPMELSRFVCALAELPSQSKVYNPFAGVASFAVCLDDNQNYLGQEINHTAWAIGKMRIMAYDRELSSKLILGDSIQDWNPTWIYKSDKPENIFPYPFVKDKFDLIISNPPFGMRQGFEFPTKSGKVRTYENFYIENGIDDLSVNGKLIAVVSHGFLFRFGSEQNLRHFLVENDLLEMVISFPGSLLMNTGIPIAVIVINKNKKEKGIVRFIDAKRFVETTMTKEKRLNDYALNSIVKSNKDSDSLRIVTNKTIKEYDCNLNVSRYLLKDFEGIQLKELVSIVRGQRSTEGQVGKYIRIRDLKEDKLDYQLDLNVLEQVEMPRSGQKISESCLLLATRWKTLKPTYFKFVDESIFISPDIIALKVDEFKVDIGYLIYELHTENIIEQCEGYRIGDIIPSIRKEDLLTIKLNIPDIKEQKAQVKGAKEALFEEKKTEIELLRRIHGLESEMYDQNSFLRHSIAGPLKNLRSSFRMIKSIIENQLVQKYPEIMFLKSNSDSELDFGKYLEIIERDLNIVSENARRNNLGEESIRDLILEPIEIFSFLENYVAEVKNRENLIFEIDFNFDKEVFFDTEGNRIPVFINGNADLLRDLFNNLVENSERHAFELTKRTANKIEIYVMADFTQDSQLHLLFSNTGNSFPENFSQEMFILKGAKSGVNGGDGFGGWYMNEIVKKHNGYLEIVDHESELMPASMSTTFYFEFPLTTN